eukprot:6478812-Amphidinium_carterae.2
MIPGLWGIQWWSLEGLSTKTFEVERVLSTGMFVGQLCTAACGGHGHVAFSPWCKATVSLRRWRALCVLSLIFQLSQAARPVEPSQSAALVTDKEGNSDGHGGCPEASQGER